MPLSHKTAKPTSTISVHLGRAAGFSCHVFIMMAWNSGGQRAGHGKRKPLSTSSRTYREKMENMSRVSSTLHRTPDLLMIRQVDVRYGATSHNLVKDNAKAPTDDWHEQKSCWLGSSPLAAHHTSDALDMVLVVHVSGADQRVETVNVRSEMSIVGPVANRAMPKSEILSWPDEETRTFRPARSQCRMFWWWIYSRPAATSMALVSSSLRVEVDAHGVKDQL